MNLVIRDADADDFARIHEIYSHHVRTGFGTFDELPPSHDEMLDRFAQLTRSGLPYLAAVMDGIVCGYVYAAPYRPRSAYRFTVEDSIYVAADSTGHGIGSALMNRLIGRCAEAGMKQMVAVIGDSANRPSIRLHARCGFRHTGVLRDVGFKQNRWLDTVIMQRTL